jgi:hypothetical protein
MSVSEVSGNRLVDTWVSSREENNPFKINKRRTTFDLNAETVLRPFLVQCFSSKLRTSSSPYREVKSKFKDHFRRPAGHEYSFIKRAAKVPKLSLTVSFPPHTLSDRRCLSSSRKKRRRPQCRAPIDQRQKTSRGHSVNTLVCLFPSRSVWQCRRFGMDEPFDDGSTASFKDRAEVICSRFSFAI